MSSRRSQVSPRAPGLSEFLFGALSTPEGRLQRARAARLGFYHDPILDPLDPRPDQPVTVSVRAGADVSVRAATLYYSVDGTPPRIPADLGDPAVMRIPMQRARVEWDTLQWCYLEEWQATIPGQPSGTHVQYIIEGFTASGEVVYSPHWSARPGEPGDRLLSRLAWEHRPHVYGFWVDVFEVPSWLREAIIYQIFVDRFAPNPGTDFRSPHDRTGFYGGTLKGITSRLDYLSDLGVDCLWLTPIYPSPSHHGYDPTDLDAVEPRLGTMDDFLALLDEAHDRGIRIILDYVANHVSSDHPAFLAAQRDRASPTYEWFHFTEWPKGYVSFYDVPGQPKLDSDHAGVREYLVENAQRWLERGVDGFRLDHAHGLSHAFWSVFRAATRATRSDSIALGEVTEPPAFLRSYTGRMDGCLDFSLLEALRGLFCFGTLTAGEFDAFLRRHHAYLAGLVLPSFLDNHDMNRFLWRVGGDARRLRLAALCQFTLPGPPIIYYGTEVGLSQIKPVGPLEESRLPMLWGDAQDKSLLAFYRDLVAFRRRTSSAWSRPHRTLFVDDEAGLYVYARGSYAVALNLSAKKATVSVGDEVGSKLVFATDPRVTLGSPGSSLALPPYAGAVYRQPDRDAGSRCTAQILPGWGGRSDWQSDLGRECHVSTS